MKRSYEDKPNSFVDEDDGDEASAQEDYETDFTFCHDEDFDDDAKSSDDSSYEQVFHLPTLPTMKVNERGRTAKTIFSLELPFNRKPAFFDAAHDSDTPGESGDGHSLLMKKEETKFKCKDEPKEHQIVTHSGHSGDIYDYNSSKCRISLPYTKSKLIFVRDVPSSSVPFTAKFRLKNPTAFRQAFKIYCNSTALEHFQFYPNSGIVPPNGEISILAKTKSDTVPSNVHWDRILVQFFPAIFATDEHQCSEEFKENLNSCLKMLHVHYPYLIHTRRMPQVILYDDCRNFSSSGSGIETLKTFLWGRRKPELIYYNYSKEELARMESKHKLWYAQLHILEMKQVLRKSFHRLRFIQHAQEIGLFLGICVYVILFITPYLITDVIHEEEVKENVEQNEGSWWSFGFLSLS